MAWVRVSVGASAVVLACALGSGLPARAQAAPKLGQPEGLSRFKLETRVATAAPAEPGDHLKVAVGDVDHAAPSAPNWACPTGVWVLVLSRETLKEKSSIDYRLCSEADVKDLGDALGKLPSADAVIINSLNHRPRGDSSSPRGLGEALSRIGVARAEVASIDLAKTGFSVYGIRGLPDGQAYIAQGDLADEAAVRAGTPMAASINGSLVPDDHDNFTLTLPDYALYDISASGDITINKHTYPVPKREPAGFKGGFHVVVVNRRTLRPVSDTLYPTNDDLAGQFRMDTDLERLAATDGQRALVFLATVGDPTGTEHLPAGPGAQACPGSEASYAAAGPFSATCTYHPTDSRQTFDVPRDVVRGYPLTTLEVKLRGAYGGYAEGGSGGDGEQVSGDLSVGAGKDVQPSQNLSVMVGGAGTHGGRIYGGAGGFNGGAEGGSSCGLCRGWPAGGGGGGSDLRTKAPGDPGSLASRMVVAAGGGGGGGNSREGHGSNGGDGGRPGGRPGGGGAGTASRGGDGGSTPSNGARDGDYGSLAFGGRGAENGNIVSLGFAGSGGGGGGGYYGGGGGSTGDKAGVHGGGGGGGGSSLVPAHGTATPVAHQERDRIPAEVAIRFAAPYGPTLAQVLRRFGATPTLIAGLKNSPRYALVGALNPRADLQARSFDSPEASPDIKRGATGELQGVLQRGHRNMWYGPAAENLPAVNERNGNRTAPTVVNYGLYNVISHVSARWPVPAGPPAVYDAQAKALSFLSRAVCACDNLRDRYNLGQNTIASWKAKIAAVAFTTGHGFDDPTFVTVKDQLVKELDDVVVVDGLKDAMGRLLTNQQLTIGHALKTAYANVRDAVKVDGNAHAPSIVRFVVELITLVGEHVPGVGPALGVVSALVGLSGELANEADGTNMAALQSTVARLDDMAAKGFTASLSSLGQTFDYLYSDWGKLSAVAAGLTGPDAEAWDLSAADPGRYVKSMTNAITLSYYRALIPLVYGTFEAQAAPTADPGKWCNDFDGCLFEHFKPPSSAYTFPARVVHQGFAPAHDIVVMGKWPLATVYQPTFGHHYWKASEPLPAHLMEKAERAGLYAPYMFLRWPVKRIDCPGATWTTLKAIRQPFPGECSPE